MSNGKSSFSGEDSTRSNGSGLQYLIPAKDVVFKNTQESSVSPIGFDMKNSVSSTPNSYDPWTQPFGGLLTSTQPSKLSTIPTSPGKPSSIPTIPSILQSTSPLGSPLTSIVLPPKASTTPTVTPQSVTPSSFDPAVDGNNLSIFTLGKSGHHTDGWIEDWLFGMGGMDGVEAQPSMVGLLRRTSNTNGGPSPTDPNGLHNPLGYSNEQSRLMSQYGSPLMSPNSSGSSESVLSPMHSRQTLGFPPSQLSGQNGMQRDRESSGHMHTRSTESSKSPMNGAQSPQGPHNLLNSMQNQQIQQQQQQQLQLLLQQQQLQQQLSQQQQQNQQNQHQSSRGMRSNGRNQYQQTGQNNQNQYQQTGQNNQNHPNGGANNANNNPNNFVQVKRYVQSEPLPNTANISPREKGSYPPSSQYQPYPYQQQQQYQHGGNYHRGFSTSNPTNMPSHESNSRERTHSHSSQSSSSFQDSSSGYFGSSEEELSGSYSMSQGDGSYSPNYKGGNKSSKYRGWSNSKKEYDLSRFELDVGKVLSGEEKRTTLMVKNIPNKYTQEMLLETISENHKGLYDFFYLPIDFKNKCNVGYSFINFIDPLSIPAFYMEFNQKRWSKFNSSKVCKITYARIQGKSAFIEHFRNSSLMNEEIKCRPLIFYGSGPQQGLPEPFPDPRAVIPSVANVPTTAEARNPTSSSYDSSPNARVGGIVNSNGSFPNGAVPVLMHSNNTSNINVNGNRARLPELHDADEDSYNPHPQENLSL